MLTPPAMSCDNTGEVLSTRVAHGRLGAQGFHWGLGTGAPSTWHEQIFSTPRKNTDVRHKQAYNPDKFGGRKEQPQPDGVAVPNSPARDGDFGGFSPAALPTCPSALHHPRQPPPRPPPLPFLLAAGCSFKTSASSVSAGHPSPLSKNQRGDQAPDAIPSSSPSKPPPPLSSALLWFPL